MCRPTSVLHFAARWRAPYAALQMEDTLAGHPLAMAFPAQKPVFLEAKGRSSRHRWLVDSRPRYAPTDKSYLVSKPVVLCMVVSMGLTGKRYLSRILLGRTYVTTFGRTQSRIYPDIPACSMYYTIYYMTTVHCLRPCNACSWLLAPAWPPLISQC